MDLDDAISELEKNRDRGGLGAMLRVAAFEPRSLVNGPGVRAVLWVQGCGRRCAGCFNPGFQSVEGGREVTADEVVAWFAAARGIEGVTFSGGEPFDQAVALAVVVGEVQRLGLGVVVFTGYSRSELEEAGLHEWQELVAVSDLLVAGVYERERAQQHPLLASANQELVFVSERYRGDLTGGRRKVEFHISGDETRISGFPKEVKMSLFVQHNAVRCYFEGSSSWVI